MNNSNENNSGFAISEPFNIFEKLSEVMRANQEMKQARCAERIEEKQNNRKHIEAVAMKVCSIIEATADHNGGLKPEDIVALAAALNHATMAMHAADNYAEANVLM